MEVLEIVLDLVINLKWPIFLILLLWKADKVKEIITGFTNMDLDLELGGQKFKINSVNIKKTLESSLKDLAFKADKPKPFPYASHAEYEDVVQIVRAMECLGISNDKIENLLVLKCMGGYYFMVHNYDKAQEFFLSAEQQAKKLSKVDGEVDVYTNLGYVYYAQKKYELADMYFKKAKIIDRSSPWADLGRAISHRESGDIEENYGRYFDSAFAIFKEQIESNRLNYLAHFGLAFAYWGKINYLEAINCFKEVTKIEPNFAFSYYNIAILKLKINPSDVNGAMEDLRKAINLNPEFSNWVKKDAYEGDDLKPIRKDKCFKCIVMKNGK